MGAVLAYLIAEKYPCKKLILASISPIHTFKEKDFIKFLSEHMEKKTAVKIVKDLNLVKVQLEKLKTPYVTLMGELESLDRGENSAEIIVPKNGEAISQGTPGDLYVKIHVKPHTVWRKEGSNLVTDLNIKLSEALLGSERQLKTLDGDITLKVPERVSWGEILRVKGKGVPQGKGGKNRGDLLIKIKIELQHKLSKNARKLVEELKSEGI